MKHLTKYTIILLASLTSIFGFAQNPPLVIDLPANGGTMIGEIIHANGKIFAYGADGISVFDDDNGYDLLAKIPFETSTEFDKFNPVYYHETFGSPDQTMMIFNENETNKYIYVITPDLKVLVINTEDPKENDPYESWTIELPVSGTEKLNEILDSQSGVVIMRYDDNNNNDRLYLLVASRDPDRLLGDPPIGNFHVQKTVFGIYEVDPTVLPNSSDHISLHNIEICAPGSVVEDNYGDQVVNFVYSERDDFFYLLRLGIYAPSKSIIEVREITTTGSSFVQTIELENVDGSGWYKMGKMLYINDPGNDPDIHKILVFPFRFFVNDDDDVPTPGFFVIDGSNYTDVDFVNYNEQVIRDAIYLEEDEDLILSFSPESNGTLNNESIAVFSYNPDPEKVDEYIFELQEEFPADNSTITSAYDLNVALRLTKINSTSALVSNKDGVGLLEYDAADEDYDYASIVNAESNFFRKGAVTASETDPKVFIPNTVANGMEVYDIESGLFDASIHTGYPVYYIAANADGSNMYFYNKLNAHNIGFYSHQIPANTEEDATTTHININATIGDIIYNPYQDHFLVSKFEPGNAEIQIYNASDNTGQGIIPLAGAEFAKEMFLAPNGNLYVCADMNNSESHNPEIFIIDASDYSIINSYDEVGDFPAFQDADGNDKPFAYYKASFEYNADNESVYISMAIQDLQKLPYNSQASSLFNIIDPTNPVDPPPGKIIVLNDNSTKVNLSHFPGKVICPGNGSGDTPSQFENKLFIAGEQFYEYDFENAPLPGDETGFIIHDEYYFLDMVYSPYHDRLFAVKENTIGDSPEHRTFEIWAGNYDEELDFNQIDFNEQPDGQIASLFYNPYDKRIYVYQKIDGAKLGAEEVKLLSFDPESENPVWAATNLGFASYFPEYDHTRDDAQFWYYNMTTPYINPTTNQIYVPNGGHSCVSEVPFVAKEPLLLCEDNQNWAWLSFPRLDYSFGDDITVDFVLGGDNIVPQGYNNLSELRNNPLGQEDIVYNQYNEEDGWVATGLLTNIKSELGYKLNLLYDDEPAQAWVLLSGEVLPPDYTNDDFDIDARYENWVGYWLYQEQSPFDAIADADLDKLTAIRAVDWCCYKQWDSFKDNQEPWWLCGLIGGLDISVSLNYGDMVILESNFDIDSFQWLNYGNPPEKKDLPHTEYYQYNTLRKLCQEFN